MRGAQSTTQHLNGSAGRHTNGNRISAAYPVDRGGMLPDDELERLEAIRRYDVLDTPPDGAFDRVTALAARHFNVPVAIISIVDSDRIWFKSHHGVDVEEIGRDPGLCASAILSKEPWVIEDAVADPRTLANPLVAGEFGLRFYAGAPLTTQDGFNLGTLCVIDYEPRRLTAEQESTLQDMAAIVVDELELRLAARTALTTANITTLVAALHARDGYTASHTEEVVELARAVAIELGLSADQIKDVERAALLHDIGKIGVSDAVLNKPGPLSEPEWDEIRRHPEIAERLVAAIPGLQYLTSVIRSEHERWDGSGYPDGLRGEEIPVASRIVFVCDAYHAMTSDRPYRKALAHDAALRELADNASAQFSPEIVAAITKVLEADDKRPAAPARPRS